MRNQLDLALSDVADSELLDRFQVILHKSSISRLITIPRCEMQRGCHSYRTLVYRQVGCAIEGDIVLAPRCRSAITAAGQALRGRFPGAEIPLRSKDHIAHLYQSQNTRAEINARRKARRSYAPSTLLVPEWFPCQAERQDSPP